LGGVALIGAARLSKRFTLHPTIEWVCMIVLVPMVWSFALVHTTADLLVVAILTFYLVIIFDETTYPHSVKNAVYVGILGGVGYLAKHYIFYVILGHLLVMHIFYYVSAISSEHRKKVLRNALVSYAIFLFISGVWIGILSVKYGFFTTGTSVNYNRALVAPGSLGHAPEYLGFLAPSNHTAPSMWEDLTYYVHLMPNYNWSPLSSLPNMQYQLSLIVKNSVETFKIINKFSLVGGPLILIISIVYIIKKIRKKESILLDKVFVSLVLMILTSGGYLLIMTSDRYLWIDAILLLYIGGYFISNR
jgi:hypothetical protein